MIGFLAVVSVVISILVGAVVILTGIIPFIIIYALFAGPIQNRIAKGRRTNPGFRPIVRAEMLFGQVTSVRAEKKKIHLEIKKGRFSGKRAFDINVTDEQRAKILPLLQRHFDNSILWVWESKKKT